MTGIRIYTVEEALALPLPTVAEVENRRAVLRRVVALNEATLRRRGGVPIPWEQIERALGMDEDAWANRFE